MKLTHRIAQLEAQTALVLERIDTIIICSPDGAHGFAMRLQDGRWINDRYQPEDGKLTVRT